MDAYENFFLSPFSFLLPPQSHAFVVYHKEKARVSFGCMKGALAAPLHRLITPKGFVLMLWDNCDPFSSSSSSFIPRSFGSLGGEAYSVKINSPFPDHVNGDSSRILVVPLLLGLFFGEELIDLVGALVII